ncbi:NAD(P)-dependent alcohol dehydrogenase [Candidatus Leptofilum sp.]|uniref:NAD(P)-dependent alcohol dehydrogenase n=1 Tax=Candidatus Leptofilum sp. TaxID=3241576 RepID=UPI003B59B835
MKAAMIEKYGNANAIVLKEIEKPTPKDNEVLIKLKAASLNASDWEALTGKPAYVRVFNGWLKPKPTILGSDVAGQVEAVGKDVTQFQPGDEVFGDLLWSDAGGFAEYVCARERFITLKPKSLTFEQASAIPQAGALALQGLRDKRQIQPGQKVLINGAGGGTGTFAVQLAKMFGAEVTGVDSADKFEMLHTLGADHVIDYRHEDYTKNGKQYDLILDLVASRSIIAYRRALKLDGVCVMVGGNSLALLQIGLIGPRISKKGGKELGLLMLKTNPKDLDYLTVLHETNKVSPIIDRCYPLEQVTEAFHFFGQKRAIGKVVITIS